MAVLRCSCIPAGLLVTRAQQLREFLATVAETHGGNLVAQQSFAGG